METATNKPLTTNLMGAALAVATTQVGQQEKPHGSNSGPMVDKYLASVALKPGFAWCQAFVYWCFLSATKELKIKECPVVKTAGVMDCWNRTSTNRKVMKVEAIKRPELVKPGMQFIMSLGAGLGHTGIVEKVEGLVLHTIEGNTNDEGSREGYEVARRTRRIDSASMIGFLKHE